MYCKHIYAFASWDNICGIDNTNRNGMLKTGNAGLDMTDRPHQYYTDPSDRKAMIICVKACPDQDSYTTACVQNSTGKPTAYCLGFCLNAPYAIHNVSVNDTFGTNSRDSANNGCPTEIRKTYNAGILERCVPKLGGSIEDFAGETIAGWVDAMNAESYFQQAYQSIAASFQIVLYAAFAYHALSYDHATPPLPP